MNGIQRDWAAVEEISMYSLRSVLRFNNTRLSRALLPQYRGDGYAVITVRYIRWLDVTAHAGKADT